MGAAVEMLRAGEPWVSLLRDHTPASWRRLRTVHLTSLLSHGGTDAPSLPSGPVMSVLENNPVLAAFGTHSAEGQGQGPVVVEWDVHLPPSHLTPSPSPAGRPSDADCLALAANTVVQHGSLWQTLAERVFGVSMHESLLKETGGMTAPKWLEIFAESRAAAGEAGRGPWATPERIPRAVADGEAPLLSVFLDVKSASEAPARLRALVRGLNLLGVHVWGVGSFVHSQLDDDDVEEAAWEGQAVRAPASLADIVRVETPSAPGREASAAAHGPADAGTPEVFQARMRPQPPPLSFPPPLLLRILSFADAVIAGAASGQLPRGSAVLFNAGSLFVEAEGERWVVDRALVDRLGRAVQEKGLRVGCYTQESHLDAATATAMVELMNARPDIFALGLSYSGVQGVAAGDIRSGNGLPIPRWLRGVVGRRR
jgi:hypothetical protein